MAEAVRFQDPESGRTFGAFLVDGKVHVQTVKRFFEAQDLAANIDGTFYILTEDAAGWSHNTFRSGDLLEVECKKAPSPSPAAPEDTSGQALLDKPTIEYFSRYSPYSVPSASKLGHLCKLRKSDDESYLKKHQVAGRELFLNYRPDTACGPPVSLACPTFGTFLDACKQSQVSRRSCEFVWELCEESSRFYKDEAERADKTLQMLRGFLPAGFTFQIVKPGESCSGTLILFCGILVGFIEVKLEVWTSGDSYIQLSKYYYDECYTAASSSSPAFLSTSFPMLLLEVAGPLLRVSGAVFNGAPMIEQLTPMLPLVRMRRHDYMDQLVRVVHALPAALHEIAEIHQKANGTPGRLKRDFHCLSLPYPLQQWYSEGARFAAPPLGPTLGRMPSCKREAYIFVADLSCWHGDSATLTAAVTAGFTKVFVKLSEGYGSQVHRTWSEKGCTPVLFGEDKLPGSWSLVTMQYMEGWKTLFDVGHRLKPQAWEALSAQATACLSRAQTSTVKGVHGDLRLPNVMVNPDWSRVCFVDFGWAGIEDEDRYPNYINHGDIVWPDGAAEGNVLKQQHDVELLKTELTRKPWGDHACEMLCSDLSFA